MLLEGLASFARFGLFLLLSFWAIVGAFVAGSFLDDPRRHVVGYAAMASILVAMTYSLRKWLPALKRLGPLPLWLRYHKVLAVTATAAAVVHAGSGEMPRGLALLTILTMLVTALSGVVGAVIHARALRERQQMRVELKREGFSDREIEERIFLLSLSEAAFREWKRIHKPITYAFFVLLAVHVAAMLVFSGALDSG